MQKSYTLGDVVEILKARQGNGTLTALADEIGVTKAYISDIYKGRRNPGPRILAYLGIVAEVKTETKYRRAS